MLNFKQINLFTTLIALTLFLVLLFVPEFIYFIFQIDSSETANFMSRRASFLFLGIAALLFFSKNILEIEFQKPIILCLAVSMLGLATLGLFEFLRGFTGIGIFAAIAAELFIAINYLLLLKKTP
ncbi:MAG: hypothetical protein HRU28_06530 [Rhizobiales bacterium]|nr:hypothetical protein [Hyphomicrobiales bacterium]